MKFKHAIIAALLFGVSIPFSKILLGRVDPYLMSSLLYFGGGFGLFLYFLVNKFINKNKVTLLKLKELPYMIGAIISGAVIAPIALMFALKESNSSFTSLMFNFESVFTVFVAALVFKEHIDRKIIYAIAMIFIGGVFLSLDLKGNYSINGVKGPLLALLACFCWALDNNFTRKISNSDAVQISSIKLLSGGIINFIIFKTITSAEFQLDISFLSAMILGFFSYGLSLLFFVLSLRHIGSARTGALFAAAPFIGVIISFIVLKETLSWNFAVATLAMIVGYYFFVSENHSHEHLHEECEHEHSHSHDDSHHEHSHELECEKHKVHTHKHSHRNVIHSHKHFPDIHHGHSH